LNPLLDAYDTRLAAAQAETAARAQAAKDIQVSASNKPFGTEHSTCRRGACTPLLNAVVFVYKTDYVQEETTLLCTQFSYTALQLHTGVGSLCTPHLFTRTPFSGDALKRCAVSPVL
jgi:hypothetical protein